MSEGREPPVGRISLIFTDIEDSTRMTRALGSDIYAREMREPHCRRIREAIAAHNGYEVKTLGDSFMIAFDHAHEALACAHAIQQSLANPAITRTDSTDKTWTVKVRIGVHTSVEELIPQPDAHGRPDYGGDDVNFAARVESLGASGQIIVSDSAYQAAGIRQRYLWKEWPGRRIKSFDAAETAWELLWDGDESRGEPGLRWFPGWFMGDRNRYIPRPALEAEVLKAFAQAQPDGSALRLVTLHASGGMGKSRLAVACAVQAAGQFPDGVFLIALDGRSPTKEALAEAIAAAMGVEGADAQPDRLLDLLQGRRSVLVLDNYESLKSDPVRKYIASLVTRTRHLRLLVTGRECVDLSDVEQRISMEEGLEDNQARELFLARARLKKGADWQPQAHEEAPLKEILELSSGIPLAVELAAAWVGKRTLAEIAKGLRDTPLGPMTQDPGHRVDEVERHRSLTRSLDWSFLLLGEEGSDPRVLPAEGTGDRPLSPVQEAFARLGVFPDTFTTEAAAEVCDLPDAQETLDRLVDCALLRRSEENGASRYGMHRFTRTYSTEKLEALPEARSCRVRFVGYYCRLVINNHDLNNAEKRAVLDAEWTNAAAAARMAADLEIWGSVGTIAGYLGIFLDLRGRWSEGESLGALALSAAQTGGDRPAEGLAHHNLGAIYDSLGRWREAEEAYLKSLQIRRELKDRVREGQTLNNLGNIYGSRGRWKVAEEAYEQSLEICREFRDRVGEGQTLNNLGNVYHSQGRWDDAEEAYLESLDICRKINDRLQEGTLLNNLGGVYNSQGRWREAEEAYQQSLVILREFKDRVGEGTTLNNLGDVYRNQRRWPEAEEAYQQSLEILREFKDRVVEGTILENLALLSYAHGNLAGALALAREALAVLEMTEDEVAKEKARDLIAGWNQQAE